MNYTEKNMTTLATMQGISSALSDLKIEGDELVYNGQRVNISKFDMSLLMGDQLPFESQLANLTPEDVYKIISLHAVTMESQTPTKQAASKNEAELEALKEKNPKLKNIVISSREGENGSKEEYINIVDTEGRDHLLFNVYKVDLIQMYMEALNKFGSSDITPEQLYEVFKERCIEVGLEDTYDMSHRSGTSEEFKAKMDDYEKQHINDKHYALGNEENNILISNDHTVTSYDKDEDGRLIQRDFGDSTTPSGELNADAASTTSAAAQASEPATPAPEAPAEPAPQTVDPVAPDQPDGELAVNEEEELKEKPKAPIVVTKVIPESEFYRLISLPVDLTTEEAEQVRLFNAFLEDLMTYRDFLLPELREILAKFEGVMEKYAAAMDDELNKNQHVELGKYYEMRSNVESRELETDKVAIGDEIQRLRLVMPEREGKTNSVAIILIMSALVVIMGIIAVVIGR